MAKNLSEIMISLLALCVTCISLDAKQPLKDDDSPKGILHTAVDMIPSYQAVLNSHAGEEQWSVMQPMYDYYQFIPHNELTGDVAETQMTAMYFSVFPDADILVRMKNISDWVNVVREEYFKTHDEVFPDDEPLWDESILADVEK